MPFPEAGGPPNPIWPNRVNQGPGFGQGGPKFWPIEPGGGVNPGGTGSGLPGNPVRFPPNGPLPPGAFPGFEPVPPLPPLEPGGGVVITYPPGGGDPIIRVFPARPLPNPTPIPPRPVPPPAPPPVNGGWIPRPPPWLLPGIGGYFLIREAVDWYTSPGTQIDPNNPVLSPIFPVNPVFGRPFPGGPPLQG